MSEDVSKIKERIRKMLALANNNPNEHEAATALAMAQRLMKKYNFEHADFIAEELKKSENISVDQIIGWSYDSPGRVPDWLQILCSCVCQMNDCEAKLINAVHKSHPHQWSWSICVFGYKEDIEVVQTLIQYIVPQIERLAGEYLGTTMARLAREHHGVSAQELGRSYRYGMASRICEKFKEAVAANPEVFTSAEGTTQEEANSKSTELVSLKNQMIRERFPDMDFGYKDLGADFFSNLNQMAARSGYHDGDRVTTTGGIKHET